MKDETVWLSLEQMSKLFARDKSVISRHIKNVLAEELAGEMVVAKFATTTRHGALDGKTQTHNVDHYNLDMIISVGYRVKSRNGIIFRKWANKILKDYFIKGYVINDKGLAYLEKTVKLIDIASRIDDELKDTEAQEIIKLISKYSNALDILDNYDHKRLSKPSGTKKPNKIKYEECVKIINELKYNNESNLFTFLDFMIYFIKTISK